MSLSNQYPEFLYTLVGSTLVPVASVSIVNGVLTITPLAGGGGLAYLLAANNLSDVIDVPTSRSNLGLTSLATTSPGAGVVTALGNSVNNPSGLAVEDSSGNLSAQIKIITGPSNGVVTCLGDSITSGVGTTPVQEAFPAWPYVIQSLFARNMTVYNLGISGTQVSTGISNYSSSTTYTGGTYLNHVFTGGFTGSAHSLAAANSTTTNFLFDFYGTNDLQAISGYLNPVSITGNIHSNTLIDGISDTSAVLVGAYVVATGLPTGSATLTVVSKTSNTITLSGNALATASSISIKVGSETMATLQANKQSLWTLAHGDSSKPYIIIAVSVIPRNDASNTALIQYVLGLYNTWLRTQFATSGAGWDYLFDANLIPELQGAPTPLYYIDGLHPNNAGNRLLATFFSNEFGRQCGTYLTQPTFPLTAESFPNEWLQSTVALTTKINTFGFPQNFGTVGSTLASPSQISAGIVNALRLITVSGVAQLVLADNPVGTGFVDHATIGYNNSTGKLTFQNTGGGFLQIDNVSGVNIGSQAFTCGAFTAAGAAIFNNTSTFNGTVNLSGAGNGNIIKASNTSTYAGLVIEDSTANHYLQLLNAGSTTSFFGFAGNNLIVINTDTIFYDGASSGTAGGLAKVSYADGSLTSLKGNIVAGLAGKGIQIKEGTNAKQGTAVLAVGTVTVANTSVTANSRIFVTRNALNSSPAIGFLVVTQTAGTSFTVTSYTALGVAATTDISGFVWEIFEPAT